MRSDAHSHHQLSARGSFVSEHFPCGKVHLCGIYLLIGTVSISEFYTISFFTIYVVIQFKTCFVASYALISSLRKLLTFCCMSRSVWLFRPLGRLPVYWYLPCVYKITQPGKEYKLEWFIKKWPPVRAKHRIPGSKRFFYWQQQFCFDIMILLGGQIGRPIFA